MARLEGVARIRRIRERENGAGELTIGLSSFCLASARLARFECDLKRRCRELAAEFE
jgi:hypothetical protein